MYPNPYSRKRDEYSPYSGGASDQLRNRVLQNRVLAQTPKPAVATATTTAAATPSPQNTQYRRVQRQDGGFDFFKGDQKTNLDAVVRETGADKSALVREMARAGDVQSGRYRAQVLKENDDLTAPANLASRASTIESAIKSNVGIKDIAAKTGLGDAQVQAYIDKYHKGYQDRGVGGVVADLYNGIVQGATSIPRKAVTTIGAAIDQKPTLDAIAQLNKQYQSGAISRDRLQQEYQRITKDLIGAKLRVGENGIEEGDGGDAFKSFAQQTIGSGVDTASVIPIAGGAVAGIKTGAGLSSRVIGRALASNVKQAGVYGGSETINDLIQGRDINPASLALNFGAPALLGFGSEVAGVAGRQGFNAIRNNAPDAMRDISRRVEQINPQVAAIDEALATNKRAFDVETNPTLRRQMNEGIADLNRQRRELTQGGYIGNKPEGDIPNLPKDANINTLDDFLTRYMVNAPTDVAGRSRFSARAAQSPELSDDLRARLKENPVAYDPLRNQDAILRSEELIKKNGLKGAEVNVRERLQTDLDDPQIVSDAIETAKRLDAKGGEKNLQASTDILESLAERGTRRGQEIQMFSLLSNRTPQGLYYGAVRALKKAGVNITPEIQKQLKQLSDATQVPKNVRDAAGFDKNFAVYQLQQYVGSRIPSKLTDKAVNLWRAGLLTAPTTTGGNILGNVGETAVRKLFVNPVAAALDKVYSGVTGAPRVKTLSGGFGSGLMEGGDKLKRFIVTGYDERNALNRYDAREINYGDGALGSVLGSYANGTYRLMSVADQPFWYGARRETLAELANTAAINQGLKGANKRDFIREYIEKPPQEAMQKAIETANYATFQNKTGLGKAAMGFKNGLNDVIPGLGDFIVPFTQVPASIATRIGRRTPFGTAFEIYSQLRKKNLNGTPIDRRKILESVAEGAFGVPVIAAGVALANSGMITFGYPEDQKERELWEAQGKQPYSVRVGDKWYSLNYIQPIGTLLAIGGSVANSLDEGDDITTALSRGAGTGGQAIMNQSFLQGVSGVLDAIDDPKRYGEKFIENTASSLVPNFIRSYARSEDPLQRDPTGALEGLQSAVPGLRQDLPAKKDMFGQDVKAKDDFFNQYLNPLRPSKALDNDPAIKELQRLFDGDQGILPSQANKAAFSSVELKPEQIRELNQIAGGDIKKAYTELIQNPDYQALSDVEKKKALKKVNEAVYGAKKLEYAFNNGIQVKDDKSGEYRDVKSNDLTTNQKRYLKGSAVDFLADETDKTYLEKFEDLEMELNDPEITKDWSKADQIKKRNEYQKLSVQKDYDPETVDLYSLSKADLWDLVSKDPTGPDIVSRLVAYGDALEAAGIEENKLRDKYGNVAVQPKAKGSGGRQPFAPPASKSGVDYSSNAKALANLIKNAR